MGTLILAVGGSWFFDFDEEAIIVESWVWVWGRCSWEKIMFWEIKRKKEEEMKMENKGGIYSNGKKLFISSFLTNVAYVKDMCYSLRGRMKGANFDGPRSSRKVELWWKLVVECI